MKKKVFKGKLSLNKETVTKLNDSEMVRLVGGSDRLCGSISGADACCCNRSGSCVTVVKCHTTVADPPPWEQ